MSCMFTDVGPSDGDARLPGNVAAFLETEPGSFKPLEECSRDEIAAKILALSIHAQALIDEAKALDRYLEDRWT